MSASCRMDEQREPREQEDLVPIIGRPGPDVTIGWPLRDGLTVRTGNVRGRVRWRAGGDGCGPVGRPCAVVSSRPWREPRPSAPRPGRPSRRRPSSCRPTRSCPAAPRPPRPLRREGPAKLTGTALYTDDIVVPGAWYGATIRSTDAHATFDALELDPSFDWSKVVVVTAADIPGDNIVSSIKTDQPILVPIGGEIQHHAEPLALLAAPDKATLREARHRATAADRRSSPASSIRSSPTTTFAQYTIEAGGDVEAALAAADVVVEGEYRVGHQEQLYIENNAMIAVPTEGGGVDRHRLAPVPVLPPRGAQARSRPRRRRRPA